jgi:prepilin-type N-terminal cleavage/methylation domain-containing protein
MGAWQRALARVRRTDAADDGFTLVEVVIALVVLGIASAGLMTALVSGVTATRLDEARTRASQIAAQQIEDLRTVKWSQLGVYADEPGYTTFHGGESVVTLGAVKPANAPADLPKIHMTPVTIEGRDYYVDTWVTWYGSSTTTPNDGSTYAQKRLSVDVMYTIGGRSFTYHAEGLRAPTPMEMKPPVPGGGGTVGLANTTATPSQTLSSSGMLTQAISLLTDTTQPVDTVVATYQLADGTPQTVNLAGDATKTHWSATIANGSGAFAAGSLTITFTATDSTGTAIQGTANVSLAAPAAIPFALNSPTVTLLNPVLDSSLALQSPLTVTVQTSTSASGVTVSYKLADGTTSGALAMTYDAANLDWTYTIPSGTGPLVPGNVIFTLTGTPAAGGVGASTTTTTTLQAPVLAAPAVVNATSSPALCTASNASASPIGTMLLASTITVEVKNISTTDAVTITLGSLGTKTATLVSASVGPNGGYLFSASWPVGSSLGTANKVTVSASATRSVDGAVTSAFTQQLTNKSAKQASSC